MQAKTKGILQEIGAELDRDRYPRIHNGGIVMPGETIVSTLNLGKEKINDTSRPGRPPAGWWQGSTRGQRQAFQPRATRKTAPIICSNLQAQYEGELDAVLEAYSSTKIWHQMIGLWLLTDSALLSGLGKKATFLTFFPFNGRLRVRSWGVWTTAISSHWIGPRHTNYPDGSICAFEPLDQTWIPSHGLIRLLDLFSLWALRQLHLEVLGRWPGRQSAFHPYERMSELNDNEFCGCEGATRFYADCCKPKDIAKDIKAEARDFLLKIPKCGLRKPPELISEFILGSKKLPPSADELPQAWF